MSNMSKQLNHNMYSKNLRDFINKDLRIVRYPDKIVFQSKKEKFVFREIYENLILIQLFQIADFIFAEIQNLRETDNEAF